MDSTLHVLNNINIIILYTVEETKYIYIYIYMNVFE